MSLSAKDRVGSKIRCLDLSKMIKEDASILNNLVNLDKVKVPDNPTIIPCGRGKPGELVLNYEIAEGFIKELLEQNGAFKDYKSFKEDIVGWWLKHPKGANTPNWDIACIAEIDGRSGLILVEAKAHKNEFSNSPKKTKNSDSHNSKENHKNILKRIRDASKELSSMSGIEFNLNDQSPYQLANRFAWSWYLSTKGIPIVLMYLGFIEATEMEGRKLFSNHDDFVKAVVDHGKGDDKHECVPGEAWKQNPLYDKNNALMYSIIRTMKMDPGEPNITSINGKDI